MEENFKKTVFISYCWTTPEHEEWVIELAKKLLNVGVDVKLDKWELSVGNDTFAFMEQMVTNKEIDKVLMICERGYKKKADAREGGVGVETRIITPEIYGSVDQNKFIPIIVEKGRNKFLEYVPTYVKTVLGIDMTSEERFGESFEELLRCIYEKPLHVKPALGNNIPSFLKENDCVEISVSLQFKNEELDKYINRDNYNKVIESANDFMDDMKAELDKLVILNIDESHDKCRIYIDDLKEVRDKYLIRVKKLITYLKEEDLEELLVEDLEKLYKYTEYQENGSYNDYTIGHFKMFLHEIFLWVSTLLFKYKKYNLFASLLTNTYYVDSKFSDNKKNIGHFYDRCGILDNYKTKECNRLSIHADKLIERCILESKSYKQELVTIDLLLFYASKVNQKCEGHWFPRLYIYNERYRGIKEFEKMNNEKYFNKIKCIFNCESIENLIKEFDKIFPLNKYIYGYQNSFDGIPRPQSLIGYESN